MKPNAVAGWCFLMSISLTVFAHEGHESEGREAMTQNEVTGLASAYDRDIRPIFEAKCFDCHGGRTRYPWYYKLPLVNRLIDYDIREARRHLDMSDGFPFRGSASPAEDLEEIAEVVREDEMPLWYYRLMHWGSGLTDDEKKILLEWAQPGVR